MDHPEVKIKGATVVGLVGKAEPEPKQDEPKATEPAPKRTYTKRK